MEEYPQLAETASLIVWEAIEIEKHPDGALFVTVDYNGNVRAHYEEQPGWHANFLHVYVRGASLGTLFGVYPRESVPPSSPSPGVYTL